MQTERQFRESEQLVSIDDYFNEINLLIELSEGLEDSKCLKYIEKTITLLSKSMEKKEKYKITVSKRWRRRQGFFSRWRDVRTERKELKREEAEEAVREQETPQRIDSLDKEGDKNEVQMENTNSSLVVTNKNEVLNF